MLPKNATIFLNKKKLLKIHDLEKRFVFGWQANLRIILNEKYYHCPLVIRNAHTKIKNSRKKSSPFFYCRAFCKIKGK